MLFEIVVNSVSAKNTVSGYLSVPKNAPVPQLLDNSRCVGREHQVGLILDPERKTQVFARVPLRPGQPERGNDDAFHRLAGSDGALRRNAAWCGTGMAW